MFLNLYKILDFEFYSHNIGKGCSFGKNTYFNLFQNLVTIYAPSGGSSKFFAEPSVNYVA